MGWFFGFKLHLICNEKGEHSQLYDNVGEMLMTVSLWSTNAFIEFIYGKLFGDKGYIGKNLFQRLFVDGIQLITK